MKRKKQLAEICLYGNSKIGAGFIAAIDERIVTVPTTADPHPRRSFTHAIYLGFLALRDGGFVNGEILIHDAGGERMARFTCPGNIPYYSDLAWEPARAYQISAAAIIAAAE